ncbi:MAG: flagellar motor protein MotB [Beijerinckiaceae bacterium]
MSDEQEHVKEIIIVRRRGGHGHDDHHGGVWKIAFADFMTAMMAFFLVLWIVNSTSKETQAAIARYFNPVKITDTTPARKGLQDPRNTDFDASLDEPTKEIVQPVEEGRDTPAPPPDAQGKSTIGADGAATSQTAPRKAGIKPPQQKAQQTEGSPSAFEKLLEARLFENPDAVLSEIVAAEAERTLTNLASTNVDEAPAPFQDPFAPIRPALNAPAGTPLVQARANTPAATSPQEKRAEANAEPPRKAASHADQRKKDAAAAKNAEALLESIKIAINESLPASQQLIATAKATSEGVVINLSDAEAFSMFGVGSSSPNAKAVNALAKIGGILAKQEGRIIIRGHTDARPFRVGGSDNWRLSASRAQVAFYMLRRGGLEEKRLERIEGHADQLPLLPNDRMAAENRRIEILLKPESSR